MLPNLLPHLPDGSVKVLFFVGVLIFTIVFKILEKIEFPILGGKDRGIKLCSLWLASFTFLPVLLSPVAVRVFPCGAQLVIFFTYVSTFYLILQLLEKTSRLLFGFTALIAVLFSALSLTYFYLVGNFIEYEVIASILDSNFKETFQVISSPFVRHYSQSLAIVLVMAFGLIYPMRRLGVGVKMLPSRLTKAVVCSLLISSTIYMSRSKHELVDFYPVNQSNSMLRYLNEVNSLVQKYRGLDYEFKGDLKPEKSSTVILVIGESARRDKLGIYGSSLDTTPFLDRFAREQPDQLLLFTNAVSASACTRVSVPSLLSVCAARDYGVIAEHPSILKIMKSAGLETVLISNQFKRGFDSDFISAFMNDATRKTYLMDTASSNVFDEALVPPLIEELKRSSCGSKLIIVHLAGSHYSYKERYPASQAFFKPASLENQYFNTIRYTDSIIGKINEAVMKADRPIIMLYASDHGEYLNDYGDGYYDHGNRNYLTKFEIIIPFLFTYNGSFLKERSSEIASMRKRTELKVSHDNISHTLLGLMGIFDAEYQPQFDLSSEDFVAASRFVVESSNKVTPLEKVHFDQTKYYGRRD